MADAEAKGVVEQASESQILALVPGTEHQALTKALENEVECLKMEMQSVTYRFNMKK